MIFLGRLQEWFILSHLLLDWEWMVAYVVEVVVFLIFSCLSTLGLLSWGFSANVYLMFAFVECII